MSQIGAAADSLATAGIVTYINDWYDAGLEAAWADVGDYTNDYADFFTAANLNPPVSLEGGFLIAPYGAVVDLSDMTLIKKDMYVDHNDALSLCP